MQRIINNNILNNIKIAGLLDSQSIIISQVFMEDDKMKQSDILADLK